jgi:hypothetical protein
MKNWKTSLMGFLAAFWLLAQPIINKGEFDIEKDWKNLVFAGIVALWGLTQKDNNVTGGTKEQ